MRSWWCDTVKHELRPVDVAAVVLTSRIGTPGDRLRRRSAAARSASSTTVTGALWAGTPDSLTGLDPATSRAAADHRRRCRRGDLA